MPVDPQVLETIFLALLAMDERERAASIDRLCDGNAALKREVQSLLRFHDAPDGGALDQSPLINLTAGLAVSLDDNRLPPRPNAAGFTLQSVLGSGGMGVVYVALQHRPKRTVALKVIRRAAMSDQIRRRFDHEAEVLARLQHPGIAQIFETGFADFGHGPQPFIAMELVPGRNLIQYSRERSLGVREQLELVACICDAVQHAHQRGVIHRDLKPANILVQDEPADRAAQPKILDFGVARIVDSENQLTTLRSGVGQLIGTLAYMSPEQVLADQRDIDTRSDVYALGVILYELLAGRLPHDIASRSIPEAVRTIRDDQPARLSAVNRLFRGDIDTIVTKALEKEPSRRYQSAAELGADLRRYLASEPIIARRPSATYQLSRFARRNKAIFAALAALVMVMVAGTIVSVKQALKATAARDVAIAAQRGAEASAKRADAQTAAALRNAYLANIAAADAALQKNDVISARRRLEAAPEAQRSNWEWRYLNAQIEDSVAAIVVPGSSAMYAARFSPDGTRFVTGSYDRLVRIWDTQTRSVIRTLEGHEQAITDVVWSPDGRRLASSARDSTARIWDATTGETVLILEGHTGYVNGVAFNHDGTRLVTGSRDRSVRLWDAQTGETLRTFTGHSDAVNGVAFAGDDSRIVSASTDGTLRIWDVIGDDQPRILQGHRSSVTAVAVNRDGSLIASASRDRTVRLWDAHSGELKRTYFGHDAAVNSVAFAPDERSIAAGGDDATVRLWHIDSGAEIAVYSGHTGNVGTVAYAPDVRSIISTSSDPIGSIRIWEFPPRNVTILIGHEQGALEISWSADNRRLFSGGADQRVIVWNAATGQALARILAQNRSVPLVAVDSAGDDLVTAGIDGEVRVWDQQTLALRDSFAIESGRAFAASDGGRFLLAMTPALDSFIVYDMRGTGDPVRVPSETKDPVVLAVSPRGDRFAECTNAGSLRIVDAASKRTLHAMHSEQEIVRSMRFSPDGRTLAIGCGTAAHSLRLWNTDTGEPLASLTGPQHIVESIAFTPDGTRVAGGASDGSIWLWDAHSGEEVLVLRGHLGPVLALQFSPDGATLASASNDRSVRLWETQPLGERHAARHAELDLQREVTPRVDRALADAQGDVGKAMAIIRSDVSLDAAGRLAALDVLLMRGVPPPSPSPSAPPPPAQPAAAPSEQ